MSNILTHIISPNFDLRPNECAPKFIILHYTEMLFDDAISKLCDKDAKVSAHYLIHKTGEIYNLVQDEYRAWHAGVSYWKDLDKLNDHSIGIEIDNMGNEPFVEAQMQSCISLCHLLMEKYHIPRENVLGHSDIAPDRKWDPGIFFDWTFLDQQEIGIKMDQKNILEACDGSISIVQQYLKDIGYKIEVTGINDLQTNYVIRAFLAHFYPQEIWNNGGIEYYRNIESLFPIK